MGAADIDEAALSRWLSQNLIIGFKSCGYVRDVETAILATTASPLNIKRSNPTPFAHALREFRQKFMAEVAADWPKTASKHAARRR